MTSQSIEMKLCAGETETSRDLDDFMGSDYYIRSRSRSVSYSEEENKYNEYGRQSESYSEESERRNSDTYDERKKTELCEVNLTDKKKEKVAYWCLCCTR